MIKALSAESIKKVDKSSMQAVLEEFPLQCLQARDIGNSVKLLIDNKEFDEIVFMGVGGSAIAADLVRSYLYFESKIPINVVREYDLPGYADKNTLLFISSYSGNTEEALSVYKQAKVRDASVVVLSSGGILEEEAKRDGFTFISLPRGIPPRMALGYLSIIPLCALHKLGLAGDCTLEVNSVAAVLEDLKKNCLNPRIGDEDNIAKYIARKLFNRVPVIYSGSVHFDVAATRLRAQLAENPKVLSSSHVFPEMNHNEIAAWQNPEKALGSFAVVMLRDKDLNPRIVKRMDLTRDMLKGKDVPVFEVWSRGENLLSRIFSLLYIGDFISFYLAILYGTDPTPVESIAFVKNELKKFK